MIFTLYLFVSQYVGRWTMEFSDSAYFYFGEFRFPVVCSKTLGRNDD